MAITYKETRNLAHATLTIVDGTGTPKTLQIPVEEGDLQFTDVPVPNTVVMNRATPSHFTKQPIVPIRGRFTAKFVEWKGKGFSGAAPSVRDALTKTGNASSWASTTTCGVYTFDLKFDLVNPCAGAAAGTDQAESLLFEDCAVGSISFREGTDYDRMEIEFTALNASGLGPTSTRTGS